MRCCRWRAIAGRSLGAVTSLVWPSQRSDHVFMVSRPSSTGLLTVPARLSKTTTGAVVVMSVAVTCFRSSASSRGISPRMTPPCKVMSMLVSRVLPEPGFVAVMTPIWYGGGNSGRNAGVSANPIQVARSSSLTNGNSAMGVRMNRIASVSSWPVGSSGMGGKSAEVSGRYSSPVSSS